MKEQKRNDRARIILAFGVIVAVFGLGMAVAGMVVYVLIVNIQI